MKKILIGLVVLIVIILGFYALNSYIYNEKQGVFAADYKDAEYVIGEDRIKLENGVAETEAAPDSASKTVTQYFGNEIKTDLNDDGREDVVFILTQETGGSGVFYYVVGALNTEQGYVGSEALFLGDRIAPRTTEISQNPDHKNVIIVNYADRAPDEGFAVQPSVAKSVQILLDPTSMQFGEVEKDFEGEADPSRINLNMKTWVWISATFNDGREVKPKRADAFKLTLKNDGTFYAMTDCNGVSGNYEVKGEQISFSGFASTLMFCDGSQEGEFNKLLRDTESYHFTSRGELIFDLKFDSGEVVFR